MYRLSMITFRKTKSKENLRPRVPDGVRIYAIGDIHGRLDLLSRTLARIDADLTNYPTEIAIEVFLGDYVDRGPASRQVIDLLLERAHGRRTVFLKGNHETFATEFVVTPSTLEHWQNLGGLETLLSYGVTPTFNANAFEQMTLATQFRNSLPESHRNFLNNLKTSFSCGDFFFVHAGVRPGVALSQQDEEDMLWIRNEFLLSDEDFGKVVVHGHTPVLEPDFRSNRINIDTGAYATGRLTCLILEADKKYLL